MSRLTFRAILRELPERLVEDSAAVPPAGSISSGTFKTMKTYLDIEEDNLHSIRSLGERLDDKNPVLLAPSSHLDVRMHNRADIIQDIFLLANLVMEGHAKRCQRLESSLYVDLGSTRDTDMQVGDAQANKVLEKFKDLFSCGWHAKTVGTLVESINDEVKGALTRK